MTLPFRDRTEAGQALARELSRYAGRPNLIVLALPRGGVPIGAEVARALHAPLDIFVVRKLGVPGHEELAMGAVASGGIRVVNEPVLQELGVSRSLLDEVTIAELREVDRREQAYRTGRPLPELRGATVILVDDGAATGSTMLAGVMALRELGPATIIAAAPVMSREAARALTETANGCEFVARPDPFLGVGAHYIDFTQTTDETVRQLLAAARSRSGEVSHAGS